MRFPHARERRLHSRVHFLLAHIRMYRLGLLAHVRAVRLERQVEYHLAAARADEVRSLAAEHDVPVWTLGAVGGDLLEVAPVLGLPVASLRRAYEEGLPQALGRHT